MNVELVGSERRPRPLLLRTVRLLPFLLGLAWGRVTERLIELVEPIISTLKDKMRRREVQ